MSNRFRGASAGELAQRSWPPDRVAQARCLARFRWPNHSLTTIREVGLFDERHQVVVDPIPVVAVGACGI